MDGFGNELMEAPEEEEGYDQMNDLTFGGDIYDAEEFEDWEAQHEKLAGSMLDANSMLTSARDPTLHNALNDQSGYNDDMFYGGYDVDPELEQKLNELVVDEDDDDDYINDDDNGLGHSKSGPKRIANLSNLFDNSSLQGLFNSEDLTNGPNIWGSPANVGYLHSMQMNNSFPGMLPNFMPGMMPSGNSGMVPAGSLPGMPRSPIPGSTNASSSSLSGVPTMKACVPAGRAMTLEELEQQLLNGSPAATNNSSNKVTAAAVPENAAANGQQQSLAAEDIERGLKAALLGAQSGAGAHSNIKLGDNLEDSVGKGDGVVGEELAQDLPDLLRHPGILHLPPKLAQLMSYQNTMTSNTDPTPTMSPIGSRPPLRHPNNINHGSMAPGARLPAGGFAGPMPPFPAGMQQVGRHPQQYIERHQQPIHPHQIMLQQQQQLLHRQRMQRPPFYPPPPGMFDPLGMNFNRPLHPALIRNLSPQQLQQLLYQQQQQQQQRVRQQYLNNLGMQRMKGVNSAATSSSGSFPLQQQQRFQQLQMMKQRGGASRQQFLGRGMDNLGGAEPEDMYAGLMEQREKDWIIKIQLLQLQTDNPYVDDYYHTVWSMKKIIRERQLKEGIQKQGGGMDELTLVLPQLAKLDNRAYIPVQFEGSLGRLTTASIHCPRQMIDLHKEREEESELEGQQGSTGAEHQQDEVTKRQEQRRLKLTLLNIEQGYMALLHVEDAEKKAMALPPENRSAINEDRRKLISSIYASLKCDDLASPTNPFIQYLAVRKGAILIARLLPMVDKEEAKVMMLCLMPRLSQFMRKDWQDEVWPSMYRSISFCLHSADLSTLVSYIKQLTADKLQLSVSTLLDDKNLHNNILSLIQHRLGVSVIVSLLSRAEVVYFTFSPLDLDAEDQRYWRVFVETVASVIDGAEKSQLAPSVVKCNSAITHLHRLLTDKHQIQSVEEKLTNL